MTSRALHIEASRNPGFAPHWRAIGRRPALRLTRYLPTLLFLAFFLGNTRIPPARLWLSGRWPALLAIFGLTLLTARSRHLRRWPTASLLYVLFFCSVISYQPLSSNPPISIAKWLVFFLFLLFCSLFYARVNSREDALQSLRPLISFFLIFIWIAVPAAFYFPQRSAYGHMHSFLTFSGSLGAFLVLFGIPAVMYRLETARNREQWLLQLATLVLAVYIIYASGSRASAFGAILVLGIALLRWKGLGGGALQWKGLGGGAGLFAKVLIIIGAILLAPGEGDRLKAFLYKYPTAGGVLESRIPYWQDTTAAFQKRLWLGAGFGVQEQLAGSELGFTSPTGFREQGSSYLGMLEELGILGATPLLVLLLITGLKNGWLLLRSNDPLKLLLARGIIAGLVWGISCNYLLYLGGAFSILFFFSVFLQERIAQIEKYQRLTLRGKSLPAYPSRPFRQWSPAPG